MHALKSTVKFNIPSIRMKSDPLLTSWRSNFSLSLVQSSRLSCSSAKIALRNSAFCWLTPGWLFPELLGGQIEKIKYEVPPLDTSIENTYPAGMLSLVTLLHSLSFSLLNLPLPVRVADAGAIDVIFVLFGVAWCEWSGWLSWCVVVAVKLSAFKSGSVYQALELNHIFRFRIGFV